jgi:hypothetical protein
MRPGSERRVVLALLLVMLSGPYPATAQSMRPELLDFCQTRIAFSPAQLALAEAGQSVVKVLDSPSKREVALFGLVRVEVPRDYCLKRLTHFPASLRTPARMKLGVFSDPPDPADVTGFTVSHEDVLELKTCKPGDCKLKLPASQIKRVRQEIDLSKAGVDEQVSSFARQRMLEYVADYRARGNAAMVVYNDSGEVSASEAFASLLAETPYAYDYAPAFHRYLKEYPSARPPGLTDILLWSIDQMQGLKPIVSITHLMVYTPPERPSLSVLGAKQIYASHYFEGGLELLTLVDQAGTPRPSTFMLLLRRSLFDDLPSGGLLNIRGKVIGKLRDQMMLDLRRLKAASEDDFARGDVF